MNLLKKYKIEKLEQIYGHSDIVSFFKNLVNDYKIYNNSYIIYGDYGVGKTSFVHSFVNEMKEKYKKVLFYEYDISKIEKKSINAICKYIVDNFLFNKDTIYIVSFEEIQSLVKKKTQDSFLKILDVIADNVIFFFVTTEYNKIVDTIKSRCVSLYLNKINYNDLNNYIDYICKNENIEIKNEDKIGIINKSNGHIRDCLQLLNIYINNYEYFKIIIKDYYSILEKFLDDKIDEKELYLCPVNELLKGIEMFMLNFAKENKDDINYVLKVLDVYFKYKNNIVDINEFVFFLIIIKRILKK